MKNLKEMLWKPPEPKIKKGWLRYAKVVTSANVRRGGMDAGSRLLNGIYGNAHTLSARGTRKSEIKEVSTAFPIPAKYGRKGKAKV